MATPEVHSLDQTWGGLLDHLGEIRNAEYSTDMDRREAQIEAFDYMLIRLTHTDTPARLSSLGDPAL
jgi:hypothetical protein